MGMVGCSFFCINELSRVKKKEQATMGVKSSEMGAKINFYPKGLHICEKSCNFAAQNFLQGSQEC